MILRYRRGNGSFRSIFPSPFAPSFSFSPIQIRSAAGTWRYGCRHGFDTRREGNECVGAGAEGNGFRTETADA